MTRPLFPLPSTVEMSRLLALAIARTAGVASDLQVRMHSMNVSNTSHTSNAHYV
jgi:hypothetical protein